MKKILSILIVAVCVAMAMPAQAQIHFGVKGGLNLSKASLSKNDLKKDNFTGFFIGPMAEFKIPVVGLGIDAALLFSQRGVTVSDQGDETNIKQNGIDIPVNLKYNIGLGSLVGIYFTAGPDFYFDFSSDKKFEDVKFEKKTAQVGLNLGAGVKLFSHLQVGANYNIPLSDTGKITNDGKEFDSYKTKTWQVSVAYIF